MAVKRWLNLVLVLAWLSGMSGWAIPAQAQPSAVKAWAPATGVKATRFQAAPVAPLSLEGIAAQLAQINEVNGAVLDAATNQLVLIGRQAPGRPALQLADFILALRLVYQGEAPGVSIDPIPGNETEMKVLYLGKSENTRLGYVMFEADRTLKILSMGEDNITGERVDSQIPGFMNELEISLELGGKIEAGIWHRMWLEVAPGAENQIKLSSDHRAILFDQLHMVAQTEYVQQPGEPQRTDKDPAAEQFVAFVNQHMTELSNERPIFYELANFQRLLVIARWLRDENIPLDVAWLRHYPLAPYPTAPTTPRIMARLTDSSGSGIILEGGIHLDFENLYRYGDPLADQMQQTVTAVELSQGVRRGEMNVAGVGNQLATFPTQRGGTYTVTDESGNEWIYSGTTDYVQSYVDATAGIVANLDGYDNQGRLEQMTLGYPDNSLRFEYTEEELVEVQMASPEKAVPYLPDMLDAAQAIGIESTPGSLKPLFDFLLKKKALAPLATDLYNRLRGMSFATRNMRGVYLRFSDDGVVVQNGFERRTFAELSAVDFSDVVEPPAELRPLLDYLAADRNRRPVLYVGIEPDAQVLAEKRKLMIRLANWLYRLYQVKPALDDDPRLAWENLGRHFPIIDAQGNWDLDLIIDASSYPVEAESRLKEIRDSATAAGIPTCDSLDDLNCNHHNVILVTNRSDMSFDQPQARQPLELLRQWFSAGRSPVKIGFGAAGLPPAGDWLAVQPVVRLAAQATPSARLAGRFVALLATGQENALDRARELVERLGVSGCAASNGKISLESVVELVKRLGSVGRANPQALLNVTLENSAKDALAAAGLSAEARQGLETIQTMLDYISAYHFAPAGGVLVAFTRIDDESPA